MGVMNDPLTNDLFPQALLPVTLQGPADLEGFRRAARALLAQQMLPEQVSWHSSDTPVRDLFASGIASAVEATTAIHKAAFSKAPPVSVPPEFVTLCETAILHSDAKRFSLLYRILWRLVHEPGLRHDPLDADRVKAQQLAQAVRRDMHKMKACVRFRSVQDETFRNHPEGGPLHVAWFEPEHHIVEAIAPFFARRFRQMRWAILTPGRSVEWDGAQLRFGPGAHQADAPPPDAGERLWLSCYRHIFRPARRKPTTMQKDKPRTYRHKRPQDGQSPLLAAAAPARSGQMMERPAARLARRLPVARLAQAVLAAEPGGEPIPPLDALHHATNPCRDGPPPDCEAACAAWLADLSCLKTSD